MWLAECRTCGWERYADDPDEADRLLDLHMELHTATMDMEGTWALPYGYVTYAEMETDVADYVFDDVDGPSAESIVLYADGLRRLNIRGKPCTIKEPPWWRPIRRWRWRRYGSAVLLHVEEGDAPIEMFGLKFSIEDGIVVLDD